MGLHQMLEWVRLYPYNTVCGQIDARWYVRCVFVVLVCKYAPPFSSLQHLLKPPSVRFLRYRSQRLRRKTKDGQCEIKKSTRSIQLCMSSFPFTKVNVTDSLQNFEKFSFPLTKPDLIGSRLKSKIYCSSANYTTGNEITVDQTTKLQRCKGEFPLQRFNGQLQQYLRTQRALQETSENKENWLSLASSI